MKFVSRDASIVFCLRKPLMLAGTLSLLLLPAADTQKPEELAEHLHVTWVANYELHSADLNSNSELKDNITVELNETARGTAPAGTPPAHISTTLTDCHYTVSGGGSIETSTKDGGRTKGSWTWGLVGTPTCNPSIMVLDDGAFSFAPFGIDDSLIGASGEVKISEKGMPPQTIPAAGVASGSGLVALGIVNTMVTTKAFYDQLSGTFDPKANAFTKAGKTSVPYDGPFSEGRTRGSVTAEYSVSFNQEPQELEAILIPEKGYEGWMPEGSRTGGEDSTGSLFGVTVKLRDKYDPKKAVSQKATFTFQLEGISSEPGVNLNFPPEDQVKGTPDLAFEQKYNPDLNVTASWQSQAGNAGDKATSREKGSESQAFVSTFDYGAFGTLRVYADLEDGRHLTAHLQDQPGVEDLELPKDDNNNHIADAWEKKYKLTGTVADADDDASPTGDGSAGDGLSLYEEYRGFMVLIDGDTKAQRTDPTRKTLFVDDQVGGVAGVELFAAASRLEVYEIEDDGMNQGHVVNFNSKTAHGVNQHGLWMTGWESEEWGGQAAIGPPKNVTKVQIAEVTPAVIAHELGHAAGMPHHGHGDYSCGGKAKCRDQIGSRSANGKVAVQGGQSSGGESCLMRYPYGDRDLIERKEGGQPSYVPYYRKGEKWAGPQNRFCRSDKGTGVNAAGYAPDGPKAGPATKDCGNSLGYIRISDRYDTRASELAAKGCLER